MPFEYLDYDEYMDDENMAAQYQEVFAPYRRRRRHPHGYGLRRWPYYRGRRYDDNYYPRRYYGRRGRRFGLGVSPYGLLPFLFF
jgi:hypothetical protein